MTCSAPEGLPGLLLSGLPIGALLRLLAFLAERFLRGRRLSRVAKHAFTLKAPLLRVKWKWKYERK